MKPVVEFYGQYVEEPEFFAKKGNEYFVAKEPECSCSYTRTETYLVWTNCESYSQAHKEIREFLQDDSISAGEHQMAIKRDDMPKIFQKYHEFKFVEDLDNKYEGYFVYSIITPYDD